MRKKRSKILDAVHATARGLHAADVIDQVTMREFDQLCPKPVRPLRPAAIKRIRESANVSQAVFAAILNTSKSSVQKWETVRSGQQARLSSFSISFRRTGSRPFHSTPLACPRKAIYRRRCGRLLESDPY
jgi:putative transcriptional regulator